MDASKTLIMSSAKGSVKRSANPTTAKQRKSPSNLIDSPLKKSLNESPIKVSPCKSKALTSPEKRLIMRDQAIVHEVKISRWALDPRNIKVADRKNPILQDNIEVDTTLRHSKRQISVERTTIYRDEDVKKAKAPGNFNYIYNPYPLDPKPEGIKTFTVKPPQSRDENTQRIRKNVRNKSETSRNPITEGELNDSFVKLLIKAEFKPNEHQWINDKKYLLPSQRGRSSQGKLFQQQTSVIFTSDSSEQPTKFGKVRANTPSRPLTTREEKMRGQIKGILEYDTGPVYKEQHFTEKCSTVKFSELLKAQDNVDKVFAKRKVQDCWE